MVVLDQNPVIETHGVVVAASTSDGVLIQQSPARNGLAGIKNAAGQTFRCFHKTMGISRNSTKMLKKVQGSALPGQNAAHHSVHASNSLSGVKGTTIFEKPLG